MDNLNFCYICNNHNNHLHDNYYFEQMEKSITTLCKYYQNINKLYIFIDNTCQFDFTYIKEITKDIDLIIKEVDLNITNIFEYPVNNRNKDRINRIGLLKFLIPYLVDVDKIIYTDCDVLFYKNITSYFQLNIDKYLLKYWNWNSGFIYFNCDLWRNNKNLLKDLIEYYQNNYKTLNLVDNDTFNFFLDVSSIYSKLILHDRNNVFINKNIIKSLSITTNIDKLNLNALKINVIHLFGEFKDKEKFDKLYTKIMKL